MEKRIIFLLVVIASSNASDKNGIEQIKMTDECKATITREASLWEDFLKKADKKKEEQQKKAHLKLLGKK
jgi:hypothetical protein